MMFKFFKRQKLQRSLKRETKQKKLKKKLKLTKILVLNKKNL